MIVNRLVVVAVRQRRGQLHVQHALNQVQRQLRIVVVTVVAVVDRQLLLDLDGLVTQGVGRVAQRDAQGHRAKRSASLSTDLKDALR